MLDEVLASIRTKDPSYDEGYVLSSMVSKPLEAAVKALLKFIDTNAGDYYVFRNLARMERYVIRKLSSIRGCEKTGIVVDTLFPEDRKQNSYHCG